jgi:large subunit ribosomal protein L10
MKKQEKIQVIDKLAKSFSDASSISLIDYTGMNIVAQQDLKKKLKATKAKMIVAKNTLIKIALTNAKLPKETTEDSILSGQTAVVLGTDDPVSPIQIIGKASSESEFIKFKAGIMDGVYQNKESMVAISKLPSKEILVGQTVGAIAGPMYALISNLENKVQELFYILGAR